MEEGIRIDPPPSVPNPKWHHAGGNGCSRPSARATRRLGGIPRIVRDSSQRAVADRFAAVFARRCFSDDDGAGCSQSLHCWSVFWCDVALVRTGA